MIDNLKKLTPGPWGYLRDGEAHYVISGITGKPIGVFTKEKDALNIVEILEQLPELLDEHEENYSAKEFNEVVEQVDDLERKLGESEAREADLKKTLEEKRGVSPEEIKEYQKVIEEHITLAEQKEELEEILVIERTQKQKIATESKKKSKMIEDYKSQLAMIQRLTNNLQEAL